jgi:hypothetical protein
MPYQRYFDSENFDPGQDEEELPTPAYGPFEYERAEGRFSPVKLQGVAAKMYSLLKDFGATRVRVTYDGGNDEGFAHADQVWIGQEQQRIDDVALHLSKPDIVRQVREVASLPKASHWYDATKIYNTDLPSACIKRALDELAHAFAQALLGDGFGTGEYQLYGACIADLLSGEITDDSDATMPDNLGD